MLFIFVIEEFCKCKTTMDYDINYHLEIWFGYDLRLEDDGFNMSFGKKAESFDPRYSHNIQDKKYGIISGK